jgi:dynein heavy chain
MINPKAMNINQLFGKLDLATKEWTEGVLGEVYRKCALSSNTDK